LHRAALAGAGRRAAISDRLKAGSKKQNNYEPRTREAGYPELDRCEGQTTPRTATDALASAANEEPPMKRFPIAVAVAAFALMSATSVFAQGAPEINGVALNATNANNNVNASIGVLSEARQAIGVINGDTEVNGVLLNATNANNNVNAAIGVLSEACQTVGVVGSVGEACDDD
jgi:hypothetical protein